MTATTTTTRGESVTGWRASGVGVVVAAAVYLGFGAVTVGAAAGAPSASARAPGCAGPEVLLVHDLAGTAADWDLLVAELRQAGWCPVVHEWGRPRPGDVPLPVGGLTGVEAAAVDLVRARGWDGAAVENAVENAAESAATSAENAAETLAENAADAATDTLTRGRVPVVTKGVGGLVVQRALQLSAGDSAPVDAVVTLGPVWNGTNLAGIADVEDLSRELGTFDAILAWERTWMDPLCEGCREAVRGSETLTSLHRDGIRTPGVAYTDIASVTDLLVHPPLEQSPPGTDLRVVPPTSGGLPVWHGELGRDPASRAMVLSALGPT